MTPVRQLSPHDVRDHLRTHTDGAQLLDVREPWEHEQARLPGSVLIPLAELQSRWRELNLSKTVIVYCHHGIRSWHAACFLHAQGFDDVFNLCGGIDAWSREVDPDVPRY